MIGQVLGGDARCRCRSPRARLAGPAAIASTPPDRRGRAASALATRLARMVSTCVRVADRRPPWPSGRQGARPWAGRSSASRATAARASSARSTASGRTGGSRSSQVSSCRSCTSAAQAARPRARMNSADSARSSGARRGAVAQRRRRSPRSAVTGVRSSWATSARNSRWRASAASRRAVMRLNAGEPAAPARRRLMARARRGRPCATASALSARSRHRAAQASADAPTPGTR